MRGNSTFQHEDLKHRAKPKNTCFTKTRSGPCSGAALFQMDLDRIKHVWAVWKEGAHPTWQWYERGFLFCCFWCKRNKVSQDGKCQEELFLPVYLISHSHIIFEHYNSSTLCSESSFGSPVPDSHKRASRQFWLLLHLSWSFLLENRWNKRLPVSLNAPTYHSPSDICLGSCCSTTLSYLALRNLFTTWWEIEVLNTFIYS